MFPNSIRTGTPPGERPNHQDEAGWQWPGRAYHRQGAPLLRWRPPHATL